MKKAYYLTVLIITTLLLTGCVQIDLNTSSFNTFNETDFSYEITKQYKDKYNISYYVEGNVTNNSDKDYSYVQIEFICYDKKGNNLGTAVSNINNLLGKQTWKFKAIALVNDVKSIKKCEYYKLSGW